MIYGYSKKKLSLATSITITEVTRSGEHLIEASSIEFPRYIPGNQFNRAQIPGIINLGEDLLLTTDWSNAIEDEMSTIYQLLGGDLFLLITAFDGTNANYDKFTLAYKGGVSEEFGNISIARAIDYDDASTIKYGEWVASNTAVNTTPTAGFNFRYSFGTDGDLYITKDYLSGTLGKKLKVRYHTQGGVL